MKEIISITVAGLSILSMLLFPPEYKWYWYAIPAVVLLIALIKRDRLVLALAGIPLVTAMILYYFAGKLALISLVIVAIEYFALYDYVKKIKYIFTGDSIIIEVNSKFFSETKKIPLGAISSITVVSGFTEKMLGYADIIVKMKDRSEIRITGVPLKIAKEVSEQLKRASKGSTGT